MEPKEFTPIGTVIFAAIICFVCAIFVASSAVGLKDKQKENELLDRQKKVLDVAGLLNDTIADNPEKLKDTYSKRIQPTLVSLKRDGDGCKGEDVKTFDQQKAAKDVKRSTKAPGNRAKVQRIPHCAVIYLVRNEKNQDQNDAIILPIEGKGLWSTLYGFIALETNGVDVKGLTFYKHAETPGLGGEVDNPKWKKKWPGKKVFKAGQSKPEIRVVKGQSKDQYSVDGLSGATITSNGVTNLLQFWLGEHGFASYLKSLKGGAK